MSAADPPTQAAGTGQPVVRPETLAEARAAVLDGGHAGAPLVFRGGGTKADWGAPTRGPATVVDTTGLDRLVRHDAGDLTVTVEAGCPLGTLQAELATAGQWLALDPPAYTDGGDPATVGGVLATADHGPRRLRYGPARDHVIGMTVLLSDGAVARSGGQVIKNVAGYDLAKLFCGALGTLGMIVEVVLRLHPLPEASRTLRVPAGAGAATALALALAAAPLVPSAVDYGEGALWVRVEGRPAGVDGQVARIRRHASDAGLPAGDLLEGDAEESAWTRLGAVAAGRPGDTVAEAASRPADLAAVAGALDEAGRAGGVEATLVSHAALGVHRARLRDPGGQPADPARHADCVGHWRRRLAALGGTVVLRRRAAGVDALVDPWGSPPAGLAAMRRVKAALDPHGRCAPGRQAGGM